MCNLYRLDSSRKNVANLFGAVDRAGNVPGGEVYPQYPGLVVVERNGTRMLEGMTWGWPLALKGKQGQPLKPRPVNNARTDKLTTPFWKSAAVRPEQRCLIPVNAFAEAVGEKGRMTRTWLSLADQPLFACAGVWRHSVEWGDVYAMVMTEARDDLLDVHDRMPVILAPGCWDAWLGAPLEDLLGLCVPHPEPLLVEHTDALWAKRSNAPGDAATAQLTLDPAPPTGP